MGYRVDRSAHLFPEGLFLLRVVECENKRTRNGDGAFRVKLRDEDSRRTFFETWSMEGSGTKHTIPKLDAIGLNIDEDEIEAHDILDKPFIARVKHKESPGYDPQPQIDRCWPMSRPPREWTDAHPAEGSPDLFDGSTDSKKPASPDSDSSVPF